jgi:hypothetical protein
VSRRSEAFNRKAREEGREERKENPIFEEIRAKSFFANRAPFAIFAVTGSFCITVQERVSDST